MARGDRASNKVIWNMKRATEQIALARVELAELEAMADRTFNAKLLLCVGRLGCNLNQIEKRCNDARNNHWDEAAPD